MENKKYELTDITMKFGGRTLYRIKALKDFSDVKNSFVISSSNLLFIKKQLL